MYTIILCFARIAKTVRLEIRFYIFGVSMEVVVVIVVVVYCTLYTTPLPKKRTIVPSFGRHIFGPRPPARNASTQCENLLYILTS